MSENIIYEINLEYDKISAQADKDLSRLCELLIEYIPSVISPYLPKLTKDDIDDVSQSAIEIIITHGLEKYNRDICKFSTYCTAIAKKKALQFYEAFYSKVLTDEDKAENASGEDNNNSEKPDLLDSVYLRHSPERIYLKKEYTDECKEWARKYLKAFLNLDCSAHKLVASGYSMFLSKNRETDQKDLASPKWALSVLNEKTVEQGGDEFIFELNSFLPYVDARWGYSFVASKEDFLYGQRIGDIVFGEHFVPHDVENWDNSIRRKLMKSMSTQVYELDKSGLEM